MKNPIADILADRAQSYDTEKGQAWAIAGDVIKWFDERGLLDKILQTSYGFAWIIILVKLVRLAQDPNHVDSWLDIGGYAKLVHDKLTKEVK